MERGREYAKTANDPFFVDALDLFIKEEQQHSAYLAAFLESQSIPLLERHWVDTVFRKLRGLAGLELSLAVLVTAEIIAVAYYRALRGATGSLTLKMICTRISEDEVSHLRFQASMLARIGIARAREFQRAVGALHRIFLLGTICVVWVEHRPVFQAAGYDWRRFKAETLKEFSDSNFLRLTLMSRVAAHQGTLVKSVQQAEP